jgi:hydrogenase maturation protease
MGMSILVLGLGNVLMKDEGVGVHLCRYLKDRNLPGVQVEEIGTEAWRLMDTVEDFACVILVDALDTGGRAGQVEIWKDFELSGGSGVSLHEADFVSEVCLAKKLTGRPEEFYLFGIQPGKVEWGLGLSDVLQKEFEDLARKLEQFVLSLPRNWNSETREMPRSCVRLRERFPAHASGADKTTLFGNEPRRVLRHDTSVPRPLIPSSPCFVPAPTAIVLRNPPSSRPGLCRNYK